MLRHIRLQILHKVGRLKESLWSLGWTYFPGFKTTRNTNSLLKDCEVCQTITTCSRSGKAERSGYIGLELKIELFTIEMVFSQHDLTKIPISRILFVLFYHKLANFLWKTFLSWWERFSDSVTSKTQEKLSYYYTYDIPLTLLHIRHTSHIKK